MLENYGWERQMEEGVYLQGRGGGTPRSAKSGSEKNRSRERGRRHSFLMHDHKHKLLAQAKKTSSRNNAPRKFLLRKPTN